MSPRELFFLIFALLGGLALFILGMNMMTEGLRGAFGAKLQRLLAKTTRNKFSGYGLGTVLGTAIHSGPTVAMLIGFINAGLLTLEQSIAPMMGANLGTTISMQMVSFRFNDYCFVAITAGLIVSLVFPSGKGKFLGRSLLGFGLLFLGMNTMSGSISKYKDIFSIYLQGINGSTLGSVLIGVTISFILTATWQSSGATIAIVFALINAGVFTEFNQVFPIVLGTHIGKCTTALMSSFGTNIEAKRCAISKLMFNVFCVIVAIIAKPLFYYVIPKTSSDLIHQTANLNTAVILVGSILILPVAFQYARFVRFVIPSKKPMPESSFLDYQLFEYPERAIVAVISELQRVTKVCARSLYLSAHVILHKYDRNIVTEIKLNEQIVDGIKVAMREYLWSLTHKYLSRRQIIMSHHLNRCMTDIERIGDHIDQLCDLSIKRPKSLLDQESFDGLFALYEKSKSILALVIDSMHPEQKDFQTAAQSILRLRDEYIQKSIEVNEKFIQKVETHVVSPIAALYFKEYVTVLDRMIRHIESIALAQKHEDFWIKRAKLNRKPKEPGKEAVYNVDPTDYLDKLHTDDYL